ncbi:MAG: ATP-binding protein, partial [Pseudomonadota bacterium]
ALLVYWACLHFGVRRRAKRLAERSQLLSDTLDATRSSLIIFDEKMIPVYWNSAFKMTYPQMLPHVMSGKNLESLIAIALQNGILDKFPDAASAEDQARKSIADLKSGQELTATIVTEGGHIMKRRTLMLPNRNYASISTDITELSKAKAEIEKVALELREANGRLESFNSIAAHDLVAPLRNLRLLHQWVRDDLDELGVELSEGLSENLASIDTLLERQGTMIKDLLNYTTIAENVVPERFDPADLFAKILDLSNIKPGFQISLPTEVPALFANPTEFEIVLRNLVSNAVKHHDKVQGRILIRARTDGAFCIFEVEDDGPGIPSSMRAEVFEPFVRLKSKDQGAGTGLGLSFIKRAVTHWGGHVSIHSPSKGRGSVFRFTVPLARGHDTENANFASRAA